MAGVGVWGRDVWLNRAEKVSMGEGTKELDGTDGTIGEEWLSGVGRLPLDSIPFPSAVVSPGTSSSLTGETSIEGCLLA